MQQQDRQQQRPPRSQSGTSRARTWAQVALLLAMLAAAASGFRLPTTFTFSSGRSRWAAARARGPSRLTMLARTPARPPQRPHTKVPVTKPGQYDISALRTNQQLAGKVMGVYDGQSCRKLFVDVGVTRKDPKGVYYPVFGMVRLLGRYANSTYTSGQRVDVHVNRAQPAQARLTLSLTPVYRRPSKDEKTGEALPLYDLADLTVGMPLQGRVVSVTTHYAFVDCGVLRPPLASASAAAADGGEAKGGKARKGRRINGKLYKLDLQERFALDPRQKTAKTEAVLSPGMDLPVFVKGVHLASGEYSLTVDPAMTAEKAAALQQERDARRESMQKKQDVDKLLIGESRKGVITKILPGGCKVGIGAKRTGFVPIDSIADAYEKEIKNLGKVLVVGGRMQVEIDEISEDGERIDLRCLEIFKQVAPPKKQGAGAAPVGTVKGAAKMKKYVEEEEDHDAFDSDGEDGDEEEQDEFNKFGYDDEW